MNEVKKKNNDHVELDYKPGGGEIAPGAPGIQGPQKTQVHTVF